MRFKTLLPTIALCAAFGLVGAAQADMIAPSLHRVLERMKANPELFDEVDNFCEGKKRGATCTIIGSVLAGGGAGVCTTEPNLSRSTIALTCQREDKVLIHRGLPADGFVADEDWCHQMKTSESRAPSHPADDMDEEKDRKKWRCQPLAKPPVDRFCTGKALHASCTAEFKYGGQSWKEEGVCKKTNEATTFYSRGRHSASREVVTCEPLKEITRTVKSLTTLQRLMP